MNVALYSRFLKPEHIPTTQQLIDCLVQAGAKIYLYEDFQRSFQNRISIASDTPTFARHQDLIALNLDFFITLGGDGTILDAATMVRHLQIPIMGVNLGRLGFLAMMEKHRIEQAVQALKTNSFVLDTRTLLYLESSEPIFGETNFALNDFAIHKRDTSSMVIIHTYLNGEFLNSYWADGIIVATPTGSTGYSLSCGGPIIAPNSNNFVLTPVAPHNLNVRPIVIADDAVLSFEIEGRSENFLCTLDSRYRTIQASCQLAVRRADFTIRLVRFTDRNFLYMIREKLNWGIDSRN
jgi:NAD+ kinase